MLKYRLTWAVPTILYCALVFFLSSQRDLGQDPPWWLDWPNSDKLVHVVIFGGLSGLVAVGLLRSNGLAMPRRSLFLGPALFTTLYGASDELHQWFVPGRSCDFYDLLADAFGATIVAGAISVCVARAIRAWVRLHSDESNPAGISGD